MNDLMKKYIAVKVKWFKPFIWFETINVSMDGVYFTGKDGEVDGSLVNLECRVSEIESKIHSDKRL